MLAHALDEKEPRFPFSPSSAKGKVPFKVERVYYCDHTNLTNLEHRHAAQCGKPGDCPTLKSDGSMTKGNHGAPCPDTSYGGLGIKSQLQTVSQSATSTANSVKTDVSTKIGAAVGQKVDASGEVSGNLSAGAKGKVKAAISRDAQASFERKWSEEVEKTINTEVSSKMEQIISLLTTAGGRMGCGQVNQVGIDYNITITVNFFGSAAISGTVSKDGSVSGLSSNWTSFTLTVNIGLEGPGLKPDRHATSCVCVPREEPTGKPTDKGDDKGTGTDKTGNDKGTKTEPHFPWKWNPWDFFGSRPLSPADKQFFAAAQPVYITDREDLKGFTASENVMVLDQKKEPGADAPTVLLLAVPGAAGAGYLVYALKAGPDKKGSSASDVAYSFEQVKAISSKGANAFANERQPGQDLQYVFKGKNDKGKIVEVPSHKIGSIDNKDFVVANTKKEDGIQTLERVEMVDRKTGKKVDSKELPTIRTQLTLYQREYKRGGEPKGNVVVYATAAVTEKYNIDVVFKSDACVPNSFVMKNCRVNEGIPLPKEMTFTRSGRAQFSAELVLRRKSK